MRRLTIIAAALLALVLLVAAGDGAGRNFTADLAGANEVPPVVSSATGKAVFHGNNAKTEIRFSLKLKNGVDLLGAAGAHIHCAPAGQNGPVVVFLAGAVPGGFDGSVDIRGTITASNIINAACGATIDALLASMEAGNTYVNVHTPANPGGEIRGQID